MEQDQVVVCRQGVVVCRQGVVAAKTAVRSKFAELLYLVVGALHSPTNRVFTSEPLEGVYSN